MTRRRLAVACAALWTGLAAGPAIARAGEAVPLRVLAAASLTEVVGTVAERFDEGPVAPSFAGSSTLARQIRDGAPADVFVSASPDWIRYLREHDLLGGEAVVLARNRLVAVAPRGSALAARPVDGPAALLDALGASQGVAIADEGVPAGEAARRALAHAGVLEAFGPRLVGRRDVRAVLHDVERGELAAGFVYATDARIADVALLFVFDAAAHPPIEYRAAVVRQARSPERARRFLDALRGGTARAVWLDAGFVLP